MSTKKMKQKQEKEAEKTIWAAGIVQTLSELRDDSVENVLTALFLYKLMGLLIHYHGNRNSITNPVERLHSILEKKIEEYPTIKLCFYCDRPYKAYLPVDEFCSECYSGGTYELFASVIESQAERIQWTLAFIQYFSEVIDEIFLETAVLLHENGFIQHIQKYYSTLHNLKIELLAEMIVDALKEVKITKPIAERTVDEVFDKIEVFCRIL